MAFGQQCDGWYVCWLSASRVPSPGPEAGRRSRAARRWGAGATQKAGIAGIRNRVRVSDSVRFSGDDSIQRLLQQTVELSSPLILKSSRNHPTAEALVAVVEDRILTGGDAALGLRHPNIESALRPHGDPAILYAFTVSDAQSQVVFVRR